MKLFSIFTLMFTTILFLGCSKDKVINNLVQRVNENNTTTTSNVGYKKITKGKLSLVYEDITKMQIGAIVNAANKKLVGGGGVCGAIYAAAGTNLDQYINANIPTIPPSLTTRCNTGDAKITPGFNLPASYIIHTVGPVYSNYSDATAANLLANCYTSSLQRAREKGIRTIAFPCISTAIYGYPKDKAAPIALTAIKNFIASYNRDFDEIIIVCYGKDGQENYKIYESLL